ncbi:MAG: response regulator [Bacteroidales bacterium]|nr:response regulator [Bacteroidales bacterium]
MAQRSPRPYSIWLKPIVVAGFVLVVGFAVAAAVIAFSGLRELNRIHGQIGPTNDNLLTISTLTTDLFGAESDIRSYMLTADEQYLRAYNAKQQSVERGVIALQAQLDNSSAQHRIVQRIAQLVDDKRKLVDELVAAQRNRPPETFYDRAIDEVGQLGRNALPSYSTTKATTITTQLRDTSLTVPTSGMLARIRRFFVGPIRVDSVLTSTHTSTLYDTLHHGRSIPDTTLAKLELRMAQLKAEQAAYAEIRSGQELLLLDSDRLIMNQIRSLVLELEHHELSAVHVRAAKVRSLVQRTAIWMVTLGAIAIMVVVLLLALIFADLSRASLHRAQLQQAKTYAEQLLQAKEQFLANMSHEIRTPLSAVVGLVRQIGRADLPQAQRQQVQILQSSAQHLLAVINDILDYSKLDAGHMRLNQHLFSPSALIAEVGQTFDYRAKEKGIDLLVHSDPTLPAELWGDGFRLKQIAMNLVSNAIKFTAQGSVVVNLGTARTTAHHTSLQLTVADTGIGIPTDAQHTVFEDFTQADPSIARQHGGTGLGLAIVKKLVDLQHGELHLSSQPGQGTTVSVIVPYATQPPEGHSHQPQAPARIASDSRVLIIDDDPVNRMIVEEMARSIGIETHSTGSPSDLPQMMERERYAAIITDIQMPGLSGYDLARLVDERGWNIPVVAITASSTIDPEHFVERGFSGYLIKPFNELQLLSTLGPLLAPKALSTRARPQHRPEHRKTPAASAINLDELHRFTGGDVMALRSILKAFLDNAHINLKALNGHIKRHQMDEASAVAHRMKSTFMQLRTYDVGWLLELIEHLRPDKPRSAQVLIRELNKRIAPALKAIQHELYKLQQTSNNKAHMHRPPNESGSKQTHIT